MFKLDPITIFLTLSIFFSLLSFAIGFAFGVAKTRRNMSNKRYDTSKAVAKTQLDHLLKSAGACSIGMFIN
jgi:hypothetical protein